MEARAKKQVRAARINASIGLGRIRRALRRTLRGMNPGGAHVSIRTVGGRPCDGGARVAPATPARMAVGDARVPADCRRLTAGAGCRAGR